MERKVATVLFVDLVDSTSLVAGTDPEVVRQRVNSYFEHVSRCIETHGGTVEKFAGDAVMAAFGVPRAHEDDAERALRAALQIVPAVEELGLRVRIGVEAGEVVVEDAESTFATGEAVNLAARLQQAAPEGAILIGPAVRRFAGDRVVAEPADPVRIGGRVDPLPSWRLVDVSAKPIRAVRSAPFVGRAVELELLHNTFTRAVRDRRAHLATLFGEPGIGKSRLVHEFAEGIERATILRGRCLPFGEGVTYWALAEMVKQSAGISDDDPIAEAFEKLRACCESDAIADLLAAATGLLGASEREHNREELLWAARAWAEEFALMQPLVLVFEDIHWAEEPLLNVIEHLARSVRDAPLLIIGVTRPELLELRPSWGGGNLRATAIELAPLDAAESALLAKGLQPEGGLLDEQCALVLEKAEGNPLFLEETVRMLAESNGAGVNTIPDTIQALIAARIDALPQEQKQLIQHASVIGRIFWQGALAHVAPALDVPALIEAVVDRELVLVEERTTIAGERAFRFKHGLIAEVAYAGLSKATRAELHASFARWLHDRAGDELLEIRAFHLDRAVALNEELQGRAPEELRLAAAEALEGAGRRALTREAFQTARTQFVRAAELEPTLRRRYLAAHAAWRLLDMQTVVVEMKQVAAEAEVTGEPRLQARALTALSEMALYRDADPEEARRLIDRAAEALGDDDDVDARFDVYAAAGQVAGWIGDRAEAERIGHEALEFVRAAGRKDLEAITIQGVAQEAIIRLDVVEAESLVHQASEVAAASGSVRARAAALGTQAWLDEIQGRFEEAEQSYRELLQLYTDIGNVAGTGATQIYLGRLLQHSGRGESAEPMLREAVKTLKRIGDRGHLCEAQRFLAQTLVARGKVDEAERVALEAIETVGHEDQLSIWTTQMALGIVRAAQGRDEEAEELLRDSVDGFFENGLRFAELQALDELVKFLRTRGRVDEADAYEERAAALGPVASSTERIA
jgi:class 3 adenylate cyclase/tetratricopeptide (TPR) repeat protein